MTSIGSIAAYSPAQYAASATRVDADNDGDNDKRQTRASEAAESGHGPATRVTLSPAAQALMQG